jgi:hypothetical protein
MNLSSSFEKKNQNSRNFCYFYFYLLKLKNFIFYSSHFKKFWISFQETHYSILNMPKNIVKKFKNLRIIKEF